MFFQPDSTAQNYAVREEARRLEALIANDARLSKLYFRRYTTKHDPPMLELMHSAYREQLLMELAQRKIRDGMSENLLFEYFEEWLPAFVRHYQQSRDHEFVLVYATARDRCVDDDTLAFLDRYAELFVGAGFSAGTGGSSTGGMGATTKAFRKWIGLQKGEVEGVALFGARLGMLIDLNQPKCSVIHHHCPPLYVFLLRMYYLGLLGGSPKRPEEEQGSAKQRKKAKSRRTRHTRRTEKLGNRRRRARTILVGGFGSLAEVLADIVELQLAPFVQTTYTHVLDQPVPQYVLVGNHCTKSASGEESDRALIEAYNNIVTAAIELQTSEASKPSGVAKLNQAERAAILGPYVEPILTALPTSNLFYRGLLLQFADMLTAGTIDGKEVAPLKFVSLANPVGAAEEAFAIQTKPQPTLGEFRKGPMAHRP